MQSGPIFDFKKLKEENIKIRRELATVMLAGMILMLPSLIYKTYPVISFVLLVADLLLFVFAIRRMQIIMRPGATFQLPAGQNSIWLSDKDLRSHTFIIGTTRGGMSAMREHAPNIASGHHQPELSHDAVVRLNKRKSRLAAVCEAYWENSDAGDFSALGDALICAGAGIVSNPTPAQKKMLFMMLDDSIVGLGIAWGFDDTEVRDQIHAFVREHRDEIAKTLSGNIAGDQR